MPAIQQDEFSKYAETYFESLHHPLKSLVNKDNEYFVHAKAGIIEDLRDTCFHPDQKITMVDIGTGIGLFEKFIRPNNNTIYGIDLSLKMLQVAQHNNPIQYGGYCQANAFRLPFQDNFAEIVFLSCVLHHISDENRQWVIDEMYRICKPGGMIIFFEHNPYNPVTQFVVRTTPLDRNARLVPHAAIMKMISSLSFREYRKKYFLYGSSKIDKFINTSFSWFADFPLGGQYYIIAYKEYL